MYIICFQVEIEQRGISLERFLTPYQNSRLPVTMQCWVQDQRVRILDQDQDCDQDPQLKIEIRISEIKIRYVRDQDQDHETTLNFE